MWELSYRGQNVNPVAAYENTQKSFSDLDSFLLASSEVETSYPPVALPGV